MYDIRSVSRAMIIGNITIIEFKELPSGTAVLNFTVATNTKSKDDGDNIAMFHYISAWAKYGQTLHSLLTVGDLVLVDCSLSYRDRLLEGKKVRRIQLNCQKLIVLQKKKTDRIEVSNDILEAIGG